ncbi:hypothetical protein Ec53638_A0397 (plasmid) [Escherichia coli 53638]|nr:hypothetical protein Ec53638_A0397 [Escherichia coli 53638]
MNKPADKYSELRVRFQPTQNFTAFMDDVIIHDKYSTSCVYK